MIRINLALKKQASYLGSKSAGGKTSLFESLGGAGELGPLLVRLLLPLALCTGGYFGFDFYVQQKQEEMQLELTTLNKEKDRITTELRRIKGFEVVRAEIERNEHILRTKIDTIEKLLRGRDGTFKSLVALSEALPKEVWIADLSSNDNSITIRGSATDISLVSDVMSRLGQSIYFKEISLRNSTTEQNSKTANFELTARRD